MEWIIEPNGFLLDSGLEKVTDACPLLDRYKEDKWVWLYELAWNHSETPSLSEEFLIRLSELFHRVMSSTPDIELLREEAVPEVHDRTLESFINSVPFVLGHEYVSDDWIDHIFSHLLPIFQTEIRNFSGKVDHYYEDKIQNLSIPDRLFFHLVEAKNTGFPFAFLLTYSEKKAKTVVHKPFTQALKTYAQDHNKLLTLMASVIKIEKESDLVHELLESGDLFHPIGLTAEEAYTFLKEIPIYEKYGVVCRIPNWWKNKQNSLSVSLVSKRKESLLNAENLIALQPTISDGHSEYTRAEIEEFLHLSQGLRMIKGKWIEIDHDKLRKLLETFDDLTNQHSQGLTVQDLFQKAGQSKEKSRIYLSFAKKLTQQLSQMDPGQAYPLPSSFQGQLRPYQETGRHWLHRMNDLKLGVLLADDMGLGKTVQVIAFLDAQREGSKKYLLVLPASLIGNWEKEIQGFAPEMSYKIYHGPKKDIDDFLTITTYGMVRNDPNLQAHAWDGVILDEAQAIKNPQTKQSKAIKSLKAKMRIAMTGTPVENHLMDLFSLFDFINPGFFGSLSEFKKRIKALEYNPGGYDQIKMMVQPFMLRRLKTDPTIVSDLPDKVEITEHIAISQKQVALYKKVVKTIEDHLESSEGIQRRAYILTAIQSMKQILNHPSQYTADGECKASDSGKFMRLAEICETIYQKRERVLVFTQYRELTEPLAAHLGGVFKSPGRILHGGTPVALRSKIVDDFNSQEVYVPFMVLSLKAGGVGLNLTAANHVIHFDRWWNPAVENQATDRAYRIGQNKKVFVHKFVCQKTMEEKIDHLIQSKVDLADAIVTENKAPAITELSNQDIMNLFQIG